MTYYVRWCYFYYNEVVSINYCICAGHFTQVHRNYTLLIAIVSLGHLHCLDILHAHLSQFPILMLQIQSLIVAILALKYQP